MKYGGNTTGGSKKYGDTILNSVRPGTHPGAEGGGN